MAFHLHFCGICGKPAPFSGTVDLPIIGLESTSGRNMYARYHELCIAKKFNKDMEVGGRLKVA